MKSSPEDFDELLKLLSLKRHEQPLPGFFDGFSDQVIARIKAESSPSAPGWRRWLAIFEMKPLLAGAYSVAVCGLLLFGLSLSQLVGEQLTQIPPEWTQPDSTALHATDTWTAQNLAGAMGEAPSSIAPVLNVEPPPGLFAGTALKAHHVGFTIPQR